MQQKEAYFRRKGVRSLFACLFLILSSPLVVGDLRGAEAAKGPIGENLEAPAEKVLVTYFYTTYRCPTCRKLEAYSRQAIEEGFPKELEEKKIVFRTLNIEEPENEHYAQDYKLYTKSLIISLTRNGREEKWKNLADIWKLVRSHEKFLEYVQHETQSYLKDL